MAEAQRHRPVEYYNPRPMILGLCFFWGIAMGFCLFYFAPPKQMMRHEINPDPVPAVQTGMTERERRHLDTPNIADVAPAPEEAQDQRPRLETMDFEIPAPVLTTDGGLTGRTAKRLNLPDVQRAAPQPEAPPEEPLFRPQFGSPPPPIPELFP